MNHTHPNYAYELIDDPDPENGLLVPGHVLRMSYAEIEYNLKFQVFTPGSVVRHHGKNRDYRVVMVGRDQVLSAMGG